MRRFVSCRAFVSCCLTAGMIASPSPNESWAATERDGAGLVNTKRLTNALYITTFFTPIATQSYLSTMPHLFTIDLGESVKVLGYVYASAYTASYHIIMSHAVPSQP